MGNKDAYNKEDVLKVAKYLFKKDEAMFKTQAITGLLSLILILVRKFQQTVSPVFGAGKRTAEWSGEAFVGLRPFKEDRDW